LRSQAEENKSSSEASLAMLRNEFTAALDATSKEKDLLRNELMAALVAAVSAEKERCESIMS
jgi:hypothetical protein